VRVLQLGPGGLGRCMMCQLCEGAACCSSPSPADMPHPPCTVMCTIPPPPPGVQRGVWRVPRAVHQWVPLRAAGLHPGTPGLHAA
jgi:hypothetical protein